MAAGTAGVAAAIAAEAIIPITAMAVRSTPRLAQRRTLDTIDATHPGGKITASGGKPHAKMRRTARCRAGGLALTASGEGGRSVGQASPGERSAEMTAARATEASAD